MEEDEKVELYLKGYEEGQKEAWSDIKSLISKYEGWELKSRIESKIGTLYQEIDSKRTELKENPGTLSMEPEEPSQEVEESAEIDIPWRPGDAYLFVEDKPSESIERLVKIIKKGTPTLFILRENPEKLIKNHQFPTDKCKFIWLSRQSGRDISDDEVQMENISPSDLSGLSNEIGTYLKSNPKGVVFLSGISFITNYNEGKKVLKLVNFSRDKVTENNGCLVGSVSPDALEKKFLEKIKGEFNQTF